jgi:cell division protein FtsW (lipid II flippase)
MYCWEEEVDLKKEGYNVNQAKIAIGSGGFAGKGIFARNANQIRFCT